MSALAEGSPLQTILPAYLFSEYADDLDLQAMVSSLNDYQLSYLTAQNGTNLWNYTGIASLVSGALLDWVGTYLYGIPRPTFSIITSQSTTGGPYNAFPYNLYPYNAFTVSRTYSYSIATNDQYRRVLTWNIYKGDGWYFSIPWLKRRVLRFLTGANGTDPGISQTYLVSVQQSAGNQVRIGVDSSLSSLAATLSQAMSGGFLALPFQYQFSVVVT